MGPSNRDADTLRKEAEARELDAAVAALVAVLDEALAVAADAARPLSDRADELARVGRSIPPVPVGPAAFVR